MVNCELVMHSKRYDELRKMVGNVESVTNRRNKSVNIGSMLILIKEHKMCLSPQHERSPGTHRWSMVEVEKIWPSFRNRQLFSSMYCLH